MRRRTVILAGIIICLQECSETQAFTSLSPSRCRLPCHHSPHEDNVIASTRRSNARLEMTNKLDKEETRSDSSSSTTENGKKQPQVLRPGSMAEAIATQGRIPYGEESRKFRRAVYQTQDDWIAHRSSFSIVENLRGGLFSGIIRCLRPDVSLVTSVAIFLVNVEWIYWKQSGYRSPTLGTSLATFYSVKPCLGVTLGFSHQHVLCAMARSSNEMGCNSDAHHQLG